jgi:tripartite motif-containing protein 71
MSREEAVDLYLQGRIDRRMFVRALVAAGVTVVSATTYAEVLAPERAGAVPRPLGVIGNDYLNDGVLEVLATWGSFGTGRRKFSFPRAVEYDDQRNRVYVADSNNHKIKKFNSNGRFLRQWGRRGKQRGEFKSPTGVAVDPATGDVYVSDVGNNRIQKFKSNGDFLDKWGSEGINDGQFRGPLGIAVDGTGDVYVADLFNDRVQKFSSDGTHLKNFAVGFQSQPGDVVVDGNGDVYVAAQNDHVIRKFNEAGDLIATGGKVDDPGPGHRFAAPTGIALGIDSVYVADRGNNRVKRVDPALGTQSVTAVSYLGSDAGSDGLKFDGPHGIAAGGDGTVFVADTGNHRIVKLTQ